ncbi:MAG: exodeoxyribonuclease VII large subunit [Muribaculaceae bacterium]|nr:exodeoxyribonuclease VII large subunit [Muribaculaceae bacterium]
MNMPYPSDRTAPEALTLSQLNARVARLLAVPQLQNVWIVAELSDMRTSGGHCYMELLDKSADTGTVKARMRGIIWAGVFARLSARFVADTGQRLATGLKVMVCGTVNFHPSFGMSFVIQDINPSYTMGEIERRRREILARLSAEGVLELNRQLEWTDVPLRVAVISAAGAAGYGDFINQLYHNEARLRFIVRLFPAVLQGERTAPTVIAALDAIASESENWDCVVIIRGGGATSDLTAFDDYDLANNVAQFPLPVIVGIGHERDVTVLDFVANMRVKTPTAAAQWLIQRGEEALERVRLLGADIIHAASEMISGARTRLAYIDGQLPAAPGAAIDRAASRLDRASVTLCAAGSTCIAPARTMLDSKVHMLGSVAANALTRHMVRIDNAGKLAEVLSPMATLRRGYSITRVDGHAVSSIKDIPEGARIESILPDGSIFSITEQNHD